HNRQDHENGKERSQEQTGLAEEIQQILTRRVQAESEHRGQDAHLDGEHHYLLHIHVGAISIGTRGSGSKQNPPTRLWKDFPNPEPRASSPDPPLLPPPPRHSYPPPPG